MSKITTSPVTNNCVGCCFNSINKEFGNCKEGSCRQVIDGKKHDCTQEDIIYKEEKDMNEMPELKAGMIVEVKSGSKFIMLPNQEGILFMYDENGVDHSTREILNVYTLPNTNYQPFFVRENGKVTNTKLIWSKKSDKDLKIEEIQVKMDDLRKELEELKG